MNGLVFITGASSGIGQALAWRAYQEGCDLALVARRAPEMQAWAQACGLDPARYRIYAADVADTASIVAAAQACLAQQGIPQVVVANAGISLGIDTRERGDLEVMARIFAVNNVGLAATFHPFIDPMCRRGSGRLVGIASVTGVRGLPGHGAYCASKAGVISYCESLRVELRGSGVQVVTISPGYIDTPLTRQNRYHMPFLMSAEEFARRAWRAIRAGSSYCVIPWQMAVVAKLLRLLPNAWYDRMLAGRPRKHRAPDGPVAEKQKGP